MVDENKGVKEMAKFVTFVRDFFFHRKALDEVKKISETLKR